MHGLQSQVSQIRTFAFVSDLVEITGEALGKTLARKGVRTRDDLADLAVDELVEMGSVDEKKAGELIMNARKHWFAEEAKV